LTYDQENIKPLRGLHRNCPNRPPRLYYSRSSFFPDGPHLHIADRYTHYNPALRHPLANPTPLSDACSPRRPDFRAFSRVSTMNSFFPSPSLLSHSSPYWNLRMRDVLSIQGWTSLYRLDLLRKPPDARFKTVHIWCSPTIDFCSGRSRRYFGVGVGVFCAKAGRTLRVQNRTRSRTWSRDAHAVRQKCDPPPGRKGRGLGKPWGRIP